MVDTQIRPHTPTDDDHSQTEEEAETNVRHDAADYPPRKGGPKKTRSLLDFDRSVVGGRTYLRICLRAQTAYQRIRRRRDIAP
jgi:hypothetical protein